MMKETSFETRCLSSLVKVFPDEELLAERYDHGSALKNETYTFQIAYRTNGPSMKGIQVDIEADAQVSTQLRSVELAPSEYPVHHTHEKNVLRTTPGLYPDPLFPLTDEGITAFPDQWRSIWVTVETNEQTKSGKHEFTIVFMSSSDMKLAEETFTLDVVPAELPEQQLIHTQWFHTDCLADQYEVDVFSEAHWSLIDQYIDTAVKHGINMILTPLFTPPLDTEIGSERPTVQLVDVDKTGDTYKFSFDRLKRWIDLCTQRGVEYFELSHLFTQWGAYHAPKVVAQENGVEKKIFGWDTDAAGEAYKGFLDQFLPELVTFINQHDLEKKVYFHVSDEPGMSHLESYKNARDIMDKHVGDFPIMDALSDYDFYQKGLVKNPIPANNHIDAFLENDVPDLWTYYCTSQFHEVSNRFFAFPSARNRVIGMQLYKFDIKGFLHWGYNFWFTQLSKKSIDPFRNTDAGYAFPSGDPFMVYPGEDGPIESIRLEVFYEALQDMRALQKLESLIGKEQVIELLEDDLDEALTFKTYPTSEAWLLQKREQINEKITEVQNA